MKTVLLIKTGRTETFAGSSCRTPSLGDVLRTTVLLQALLPHRVTWVTSCEALPLLQGNTGIHELLTEDELPSKPRSFDMIINLENEDRWLEYVKTSGISQVYGFCENDVHSLSEGQSWQEGLYQLIGQQWTGQDYVFRNVTPEERFDVGLNWQVGSKWPGKSWDLQHWTHLHDRLSNSYSVSWQEGLNSLDEYIQWIAKCDTVITLDSLGLHLALALKKNVIALFGPTAASHVELYGRGVALTAPSGRMQDLNVKDVVEAFDRQIAGTHRPLLHPTLSAPILEQ